MAATKEIAVKNLRKAHKSPTIGKHGKWLKTLEAEKQREVYLQTLAEHMDTVVGVQLKVATGKGTKKEVAGEKDRKEIIHQFVGKPIERVEVRQVTLKIDV